MVPLVADLVLMAPRYAGLARDLARGHGHPALGAAVLAELGLAGRVGLRHDVKGGIARVEVQDGPDDMDPIVAERLTWIEPGVELTDRLLARLAWQLPQAICQQLALLDLVMTDDRGGRKAWACLPRDSSYLREVVDRLENVILNGPHVDPEPAALAGLLGVLDAINDVVRLPGMHPKEVRRRALMLSRDRAGDPASQVLHGACMAMALGTYAPGPVDPG